MRTLALALLSAAWLFSTSTQAQTCAAPAAWQPDSSGAPNLTGTTCNHEQGIVSVCQGNFDAPHEAFVLRIFVAQSAPFTDIVLTGGTGYSIVAYLIPFAGGCNTNGACTTAGDSATPLRHVDIPEGDYFLIITGAGFSLPGACGTFSIATNGNLPVELQTFTVS